ncbi:hypothetical protein ACFQY0_13870 [Haloferula chungangensis]|uniref:DUF1800 domain-containing protein n=1 Tax=Haloferula chungangensis TaxID=1048331 RepID=A0ABW2L7D7_9BACT
MSSSTRTLILASLLVLGAITLALTREPKDSKPEREESPIPTLARTKLPPRQATVAQLLSSRSDGQDRNSWAKSLSNKDLRRLTLEMIDVYQNEDDHSKTTPWLTALAMEWGRRDIDEFFEIADASIFTDPLHGQTSSGIGLLQSLRSAALVGLSEDDPNTAWNRLNEGNSSELARTNADFILPAITAAETLPLATEAIFRSWAKLDAASAWKELSSSDDLSTTNLASAIRGLLAETNSAELRNEIEDWVKTNHPVVTIPGIPLTPGADVINIITDSPRKGDSAITRNSINAILNNPNRRHYDALAMQGAIALGIAEQDPSQIGRLTESLTADSQASVPMHTYLTEWVDRHPNEAINFQSENLLSDRDRISIASGLINHDPRATLDTFTGIKDPQIRLNAFNAWVGSTPWLGRSEAWPLIDGMKTYVPVSSALQTLEQNISRLNLPPQSEQKAIESLKKLATSSNVFTSGGFEFPSEGE